MLWLGQQVDIHEISGIRGHALEFGSDNNVKVRENDYTNTYDKVSPKRNKNHNYFQQLKKAYH